MNNYFFFIDVRKYFVSMALLRKFRISKLYQHSKNVAVALFKLVSIKMKTYLCTQNMRFRDQFNTTPMKNRGNKLF